MEGSLREVIGNKLIYIYLFIYLFIFDKIYVKRFLMSDQICSQFLAISKVFF